MQVATKAAGRRRNASRRRLTLTIGLAMLAIAIIVCVAAPLFAKDSPTAIDALRPLAGPLSPGHLLGNGCLGGKGDSVLMRLVYLFFAFPFLVLIIAIVAMLGPSIFNMFVAIWITSWVSYARIMRAQTVIAKKQQYVLAAQALGYGRLRIMFRHILPNTVSAVIIFSMVDAVGNIILAASLGFLGLGAQPPSPEWGTMISDAQNYILSSWWIATIPGLAVGFVGVAFSLIGDGLADLLRPGER